MSRFLSLGVVNGFQLSFCVALSHVRLLNNQFSHHLKDLVLFGTGGGVHFDFVRFQFVAQLLSRIKPT